VIKIETIQDIVIDMKNFKAFISEAEAVPERTKPLDSSKPFKEPQPNPLQTGPRRVRRKSSAGPGTTAEPESGSRTTRTRTSALRPEYFDADGNLRPEAARRFAERRAGAGYSRPGQSLTPERKAALDKVNDLFKRFDAGDADAVGEVKSIRDRIIQKHGAANNHPSFREVKTGTSPAPSDSTTQQLRNLQGRKGQAPLDPALQQAVSDRLGGTSSSPTIDNPGRPEQSVMDKTRAAADARRAGVADAGTRTPRPGVRTDDVLDAIRNVPDEPQLPKVTGGQSRVTDRGTLTNPLTQADLKREIINRRGRRVTLPSVKPPTGGPSLGSPTASGITPQRAANIAAARSATPQGAVATAQGITTASRFMQAARLAGRGAQVAAAGMDYYAGSRDAKDRGAGTTRQVLRGLSRAAGGVVGGTVGAGTGAFLGTAGGSFTGPGALVTGTAGAFTGGAAGSQLGSRVADQVFQTVAGATDAEKKLMRQRKRQSQINMFGQGPKTQARTGNTAIVTGRDGKQRVGYLSYKDGKPVYTAPNAPSTLRYTSSNPIERIGRSLPFLQGYYANKDETNRQNDIAKQWRKFNQASQGRI
tara:strand:+ start:587 stop:2350 length:1764 start_codon:yes stop_codon:yes gene_type:complete